MRIIQSLTNKELKNFLYDFYNYFKTGFEFEAFLKPLLESVGLTEVVVTQKTRDDGIDLTAVRNGLSEFNNADYVKYRVQAKRNTPDSFISPEKIDALRGNLGFNEKGLFITTAKVSDVSKERAASKDPYKPVFVIDGIDLIRICIEKQIGFAYKPIFSKESLDDFTDKTNCKKSEFDNMNKDLKYAEKTVVKLITANDVRCNIISIPRYIVDCIKNNDLKQKKLVIINSCDSYKLTYSPGRKYFYLPNSKEFFLKYGIIQEDGSVLPKEAVWSISDNQTINISI